MYNHLALSEPIAVLPRVGAQAVKNFKKLGVVTVRDLLFHFPFRHEDFSRIVGAAHLKIGEQASVRCRVHTIKNTRSPKKRRLFTEAIFEDNSGSVKAVWFNQPYLPKLLSRGDRVFLSGTLEKSYFGLHMTNPIFEKIRLGETATHAGRLVPIYHTRGALTNRGIRTLVRAALGTREALIDWLPEDIRARYALAPLSEAIHDIHFPGTTVALAAARKRLAFQELFTTGLVAARARAELDAETAPAIPFREDATKAFVKTLPFSLTDDQRKAAWTILKDMERSRPMNRLLEGDVGSGKTVVAAITILNATLAGFATTYLAPTEILARQHATTLRALLRGFPVRAALFTRAYHELDGEPLHRGALHEKIKAGEVELVIGTHALLEETVRHPKTGLVIIDEQHRFGVRQRKRLRTKGTAIPHLLSMTATPIPRTLALTVYGDLDIAKLRELPAGRKPIATQLVTETQRAKTWQHIREELRAGRQAFVICPLISESDALGVRAATTEYKRLRAAFPEFQLGLLHGKLASDAKRNAMENFATGRTQLLVATAVVEVGIDIPNATIMVIEGAERFGLAQLHQFRGRIGRGSHASRCYLFVDTDTNDAHERLLSFSRIHDGFALAEKDLELRGPGEIFGTEQSGIPRFRIANLRDIELIQTARNEAQKLVANDPGLTNHPLLRDHIADFAGSIHLE